MKCVSSFALEINMSNYQTYVMSTISTHEYRLIQVRSHLHSSFSVITQSWHGKNSAKKLPPVRLESLTLTQVGLKLNYNQKRRVF